MCARDAVCNVAPVVQNLPQSCLGRIGVVPSGTPLDMPERAIVHIIPVATNQQLEMREILVPNMYTPRRLPEQEHILVFYRAVGCMEVETTSQRAEETSTFLL